MTAEGVAAESSLVRTPWRSLPSLALVPISAVAWWGVGFLPWFLNGTGHDVLADRGTGSLALPLVSVGVSTLVLCAGFGGVLGGLTARLGTGRLVARVGACASGVVLALFVTIVQSRSGIAAAVDGRITNGLTIVAVLTTLVGLGLGLLAVTGRIGLGLALGAAAGATPMWVMSVFNALQVDDTAGGLAIASDVSRWSGALVLAVALVAIGLQTTGRAAAWLGVLLLAWLIGPTVTAAGYMEVYLRPGMGLPDMWGDHLSATMDVWRMSAGLDARPLTPWVVAVVVAGGVALWLARRPSADADHPAQ